MALLKCEHLTKIYRQGDTSIYAANGINMTMDSGDFVVVMGKSGSGKSTLLNLCAGMIKPDSGKIFFEDEEITSWKYDRLARYHRNDIPEL